MHDLSNQLAVILNQLLAERPTENYLPAALKPSATFRQLTTFHQASM